MVGAGEDGTQGGLGLWESILREAATEKRAPDATLLLLGRRPGKRTLMQALLAYACPSAAAADAAADNLPEGKQHSRAVTLDYAYFGARDPETTGEAQDPHFVCNSAVSVLILEDVRHEKLLRSRLNLNADGLRHCAAVICLDLKEPWTMMEDLRQWLELLRRLTADLQQKLDLEEQDALRARLLEVLSSYREPAEPGAAGAEPAAAGESGAAAALAYNLGIPLIVAVTRADGASALETQKTVGWSETIEAYLRSECLPYGAAIVYTMVQAKNNRNVDVLYDYLMHRLYDYPLKRKAHTPSRDALFLPSGWDNQAKVDQLAAALPGGAGLERSFESVVVPLEPPKAEVTMADECEDMQAFLKRSAMLLQKLGGTSAVKASGGHSAAPAQHHQQMLDLTSTGSNRRLSERPEGGGPVATDNSSLANFFQTLLTRGSTQGRASAVAAAAPGGSPVAGAPAGQAAGVTKSVTINLPEDAKVPEAEPEPKPGLAKSATVGLGETEAKAEASPPAAPAAPPPPAAAPGGGEG